MADREQDDHAVVVSATIQADFAELTEGIIALIERLPRNDIDRVSIEVPLGRMKATIDNACDLEEKLDTSATAWAFWSREEIRAHYGKLLSLVEKYTEAKSEEKDAAPGEERKAALAKRKEASAALLKYVGEV